MTPDKMPGQIFQCLHHNWDWLPATPGLARAAQPLWVTWRTRGTRPPGALVPRGAAHMDQGLKQQVWQRARGVPGLGHELRQRHPEGPGCHKPPTGSWGGPGWVAAKPLGQPLPAWRAGAQGHCPALAEAAVTGAGRGRGEAPTAPALAAVLPHTGSPCWL